MNPIIKFLKITLSMMISVLFLYVAGIYLIDDFIYEDYSKEYSLAKIESSMGRYWGNCEFYEKANDQQSSLINACDHWKEDKKRMIEAIIKSNMSWHRKRNQMQVINDSGYNELQRKVVMAKLLYNPIRYILGNRLYDLEKLNEYDGW